MWKASSTATYTQQFKLFFLHFLTLWLAPKGNKRQVLRGQMQPGPVLLLCLPWVCKCNTVEDGSVPWLIHHLAEQCRCFLFHMSHTFRFMRQLLSECTRLWKAPQQALGKRQSKSSQMHELVLTASLPSIYSRWYVFKAHLKLHHHALMHGSIYASKVPPINTFYC